MAKKNSKKHFDIQQLMYMLLLGGQTTTAPQTTKPKNKNTIP